MFFFFLQFSAYNYHKIQTNIGGKKLNLGCGEEEDFVCDSSIPGTVWHQRWGLWWSWSLCWATWVVPHGWLPCGLRPPLSESDPSVPWWAGPLNLLLGDQPQHGFRGPEYLGHAPMSSPRGWWSSFYDSVGKEIILMQFFLAINETCKKSVSYCLLLLVHLI